MIAIARRASPGPASALAIPFRPLRLLSSLGCGGAGFPCMAPKRVRCLPRTAKLEHQVPSRSRGLNAGSGRPAPRSASGPAAQRQRTCGSASLALAARLEKVINLPPARGLENLAETLPVTHGLRTSEPDSSARPRSPSTASSSESEADVLTGRRRVLARRRCHRLRLYLNESEEASERGSSFLLDRAVSAKVQTEYRRELLKFMDFLGRASLDDAGDGLVDDALVRFFEQEFFRGEQASRGLKLLAGVMHAYPEFGRTGHRRMPKAWRALRGWQRLTPGHSRRPETLGLWAGVANALCVAGQTLMGFFVMLSVSTYARPSSLLALVPEGIVEPVKSGARFWSLLLHPQELAVPSKTMDYDISIRVDSPYMEWAGQILASLRLRPAGVPVWGFDYWHYLKAFRTAAVRLNLKIDPIPDEAFGGLNRQRGRLAHAERGQTEGHLEGRQVRLPVRQTCKTRALRPQLPSGDRGLLQPVRVGSRGHLPPQQARSAPRRGGLSMKGCYFLDVFLGRAGSRRPSATLVS